MNLTKDRNSWVTLFSYKPSDYPPHIQECHELCETFHRNQNIPSVRRYNPVNQTEEEWGRTRLQFNSVAQSCPTLWDAMDCSIPGFPVHH